MESLFFLGAGALSYCIMEKSCSVKEKDIINRMAVILSATFIDFVITFFITILINRPLIVLTELGESMQLGLVASIILLISAIITGFVFSFVYSKVTIKTIVEENTEDK